MSASRRRIETRVVHAGLDPDPTYGSVIPPIHQTSTYVQPAPGEFVEDYDYARSANPTRAALETALGELEGGRGTAFASGMAATHALITAALEAGDHLILPLDLYGGTYRLVDKVLTRFGLAYDLVDQRDLDALRSLIRPRTRMIWVETPTNPLLNVVDISEVVRAAEGVSVVVDNTFATPIVQRPLELGATAVVHSTTKYLGGHSDVVGGAVVTRRRASCTSGSGSCRTRSARCRGPSTASSSIAGFARSPCRVAPAHGERTRRQRAPRGRAGRR